MYLRQRFSHRLWRVIAILLSVGVVATLSVSGHPIVQHPAAFSVAVDIVHLFLVSIWVGGIVTLSLATRSWTTDRYGAMVQRFSRFAPSMVLVIVITGVIQAWMMMDGFGTMFSTIYGRTLIIKTTAVVVLVSLGWLSRSTLKRNGPVSVKRVVGI